MDNFSGGSMDPFSALISGAFSAYNTYETNALNRGMFDDSNTFNENEAIKQRMWSSDEARINRAFQGSQIQAQQDFQERMSNTAWQRGTDDMQAAGLNPMLAFRQGGASSPMGGAGTGSMPSGAVASSVNPPRMEGLGSRALASAAQAAAIAKTMADTDLVKAQEEVTRADIKDPNATRNMGGDLPTKTHSAAEKEARSRALHYEAKRAEEQVGLTNEQRKLVIQEIENAVEQNKKIRADTRNASANAVLNELAEAEAKNQYRHHLKYPGYNIDVEPFIGGASKGVGSALGIRRLMGR